MTPSVWRRPKLEARSRRATPSPTVIWVVSSVVAARRLRTRKRVRTMTSAATKSSTSAWTIRTASMDRPRLLLHQAGARRASSPTGPR